MMHIGLLGLCSIVNGAGVYKIFNTSSFRAGMGESILQAVCTESICLQEEVGRAFMVCPILEWRGALYAALLCTSCFAALWNGIVYAAGIFAVYGLCVACTLGFDVYWTIYCCG